MEGTASSIFGGGTEERKIYAPVYKKNNYGKEDIYNIINGIYSDTVEKFLDNIKPGAVEIDLFSYDYIFERPDGQKILMHTDVTCRNGNVYVKDNNSERIMCIPGENTLRRTEAYLTALYRDMGYVDLQNIKIANQEE